MRDGSIIDWFLGSPPSFPRRHVACRDTRQLPSRIDALPAARFADPSILSHVDILLAFCPKVPTNTPSAVEYTPFVVLQSRLQCRNGFRVRPSSELSLEGREVRSSRICRCVAEQSILGGHQNPHGQEPRSLRCGVRRIGASFGDSGEMTNGTGESHHLHRRLGRYQAHGIRRSGPRADVRGSGAEAHRGATESPTG
jgi:hypothetical protein